MMEQLQKNSYAYIPSRKLLDQKKIKHQFFEQVFKKCKEVFSVQQFSFLMTLMKPRRSHLKSKQKENKITLEDYDTEQVFENINPKIFTSDENFRNFGDFSSIKKKTYLFEENRKKKKNRLLTTPTERKKQKVQREFDSYEALAFYKKMINHKQKIKKLAYNAEPLFHRNPKRLFHGSPQTLVIKNTKNDDFSDRKKKSNRILNFTKNNNKVNQGLESIPKSFLDHLEIVQKVDNNFSSNVRSLTTHRKMRIRKFM